MTSQLRTQKGTRKGRADGETHRGRKRMRECFQFQALLLHFLYSLMRKQLRTIITIHIHFSKNWSRIRFNAGNLVIIFYIRNNQQKYRSENKKFRPMHVNPFNSDCRHTKKMYISMSIEYGKNVISRRK